MMTLIRCLLDKLYTTSGIVAAISMAAMMVLVIAQIVARQLHTHIPSSDDMIGFLVVWTSFLGLAYTLHHQQHIRVELILGRVSRKYRKYLNILVGLLATIMLAVFSYFVIALIYESWSFGDQTDGEVPMPLWLMQLPMGIGCILFTVSMLDFTIKQIAEDSNQPVTQEQ